MSMGRNWESELLMNDSAYEFLMHMCLSPQLELHPTVKRSSWSELYHVQNGNGVSYP